MIANENEEMTLNDPKTQMPLPYNNSIEVFDFQRMQFLFEYKHSIKVTLFLNKKNKIRCQKKNEKKDAKTQREIYEINGRYNT